MELEKVGSRDEGWKTEEMLDHVMRWLPKGWRRSPHKGWTGGPPPKGWSKPTPELLEDGGG